VSSAAPCRRVVVTGSEGLIGKALRAALTGAGFEVIGLDLAGHAHERGDTRDATALSATLQGCVGVIHLAAVSRVLVAEEDPPECWSTNVQALHQLLELVRDAPQQPWLVFGSSREVYGDTGGALVDEDAPLAPINLYASSKVAGEELIASARDAGIRAVTVRFSNVYGRAGDHEDRVIPAFVRAALRGRPLVVRGAEHHFDFTHVDDVSEALASLVHLLEGNAGLPPTLHFITGRSTSLGALARMVRTLARSQSPIVDAPVSALHVRGFRGSPARAARVLGWSARTPLEVGLARLIEETRRALAASELPSRSVACDDAWPADGELPAMQPSTKQVP
jgi:nucleoside-diphosphate-sugar epimerase